MDLKTIKTLNKLNTSFYEKVADDFDKSRQQPWQGWQIAFENEAVTRCKSVIDICCGNGRFAKFASKQGIRTYLGLDSNSSLLKQAQVLAPEFQYFKLKNIDVISTLIGESIHAFPTSEIKSDVFESPKLFVLFGVMHHIPSFELRKKVLNLFSELMTNDDILVISCWQFTKIPSLMKRVVTEKKLGLESLENIASEQLEEHDYILDWQRGKQAYRYCHLVTENEANMLIENTQIEIKKQWDSDGKTNNLNTYYILQKKQYNDPL